MNFRRRVNGPGWEPDPKRPPLTVDEAQELLDADMTERGDVPPHPRAGTVPPSATADLSPTGSRTGNFTFTPGLRDGSDAA